MEFMSIRRESERLVVRPMMENDFKTILEGLKGQGPLQNQYDGEEIELTEVFTEAFCKETAESVGYGV